MRNIHAAELQAVGIRLVMWHQVIVVEHSYPEHCGVDADTQEEDTDEAHHLVERNNTTLVSSAHNTVWLIRYCYQNLQVQNLP